MTEKYLDLTNAVYSLIDFFPDGEPLKIKAKETALEAMDNLVAFYLPSNPQKGKAASQALKEIELVKSYLNLGKNQSWVKGINLLIVFKEYEKIVQEITPIALAYEQDVNQEKVTKVAENSQLVPPVDKVVDRFEKGVIDTNISSRQKNIIKLLETQPKIQVADIKKVMPEISKRTLRRDLDDMLKKNLIIREGEWNQIIYQLVRKETVQGSEASQGDRTSSLS